LHEENDKNPDIAFFVRVVPSSVADFSLTVQLKKKPLCYASSGVAVN
jgi:hypothetical protein